MPRSMLIVEDHPIFGDAVQGVLSRELRSTTFAHAVSLGDAVDKIDDAAGFDLVLLDLMLPDVQGLDGLVDLRARYPRLPIAVLSAYGDEATVRRAEICGAAGFISKSVTKSELVDAIRVIMRGGTHFVSDRRTAPDANQPDCATQERLESLTPQQMRVMKMLCAGMLNKQIAFELEVGETTVKAHVGEILRKLGVSSRTQAVLQMSKFAFDVPRPASDEGTTQAANGHCSPYAPAKQRAH